MCSVQKLEIMFLFRDEIVVGVQDMAICLDWIGYIDPYMYKCFWKTWSLLFTSMWRKLLAKQPLNLNVLFLLSFHISFLEMS